MNYGTPKDPDEITLEEAIANPIWVYTWESGQEDLDGVDESFQSPVLGCTDVDEDFEEPIITFKVEGTAFYGSGSYDLDDDELSSISIWDGERWMLLEDSYIEIPARFIALPSIQGEDDCVFICNALVGDMAVGES